MKLAFALLLALSPVEGFAQTAIKHPRIDDMSQGQRRFLAGSTVVGAAALAASGSQHGAGTAVAGALGGAAIGFVAGAALIGIGAGLYYLWTGRRAKPFTARG